MFACCNNVNKFHVILLNIVIFMASVFGVINNNCNLLVFDC